MLCTINCRCARARERTRHAGAVWRFSSDHQYRTRTRASSAHAHASANIACNNINIYIYHTLYANKRRSTGDSDYRARSLRRTYGGNPSSSCARTILEAPRIFGKTLLLLLYYCLVASRIALTMSKDVLRLRRVSQMCTAKSSHHASQC